MHTITWEHQYRKRIFNKQAYAQHSWHHNDSKDHRSSLFCEGLYSLHGGFNNIDVPWELIKKCSLARQYYKEDLKAGQESKKREDKARKEMNQKKADTENQKHKKVKLEMILRKLRKKKEKKKENF